MEKIIVDENICIGCGFCAASNENVFDMGEDTAYTKENNNLIAKMSDEEKEEVMDILEGCPVGAIKVENEDK